jgi:hypothetical protein
MDGYRWLDGNAQYASIGRFAGWWTPLENAEGTVDREYREYREYRNTEDTEDAVNIGIQWIQRIQ